MEIARERSASAVSGALNASASGAPPLATNNGTSAANNELLPQRLDAITKLLDIAALYTSLASLRTQLADRNDVIERQSVRLRGLVSQVAAMEAAKSRYNALLEHKDTELQRLQEQLAVKDAEAAAAIAHSARMEHDVQRLTATAARMQAQLDGASAPAEAEGDGTVPARIGFKRKLPEPPGDPTPPPAARASPRTRTTTTTPPSASRKQVPRELAALQAAASPPKPRGPRLASGSRAHTAALADKGRARALATARKATADAAKQPPKASAPKAAQPAPIVQKARVTGHRGGRTAADSTTWWDLAEIAPGNIVCVRCSRPDQYSLRLPGKQERFVWICSVTKIRGTTIYGRWYHNAQRNLSLPFRLGPELKVPVRIKGRQDILHIYEEDKDFVLSKAEVEELVAEYTHSLTLVFGDASESEGSEES